jgi:adenylosuccinate synthase
VTRAYHTRHGAGPFREQGSLKLSNKKTETNQYNPFQQNFKISYLDIDLVNYALKCDNVHSSNINKNLVITCVDQIKSGFIRYFLGNELHKIYYNKLPFLLNFNFKTILFSSSVFSENFTSSKK